MILSEIGTSTTHLIYSNDSCNCMFPSQCHQTNRPHPGVAMVIGSKGLTLDERPGSGVRSSTAFELLNLTVSFLVCEIGRILSLGHGH